MKGLVYLLRLLVLVLFFWAGTLGLALAVQVHGAPEGFYTHILAHLFFTASIIFLLFFSRRYPVGSGKAWRYCRISLILFLLWNLDTMMVHFLDLRLPEHALFLPPDPFAHRLYGPLDFERWVYYLGRFDHLLCVPAMWFMVQSLRVFYKEQQNSQLKT